MIVPAEKPHSQDGASEPTSTKRSLPDPETVPAPKAKRAKDRAKSTTSGTQEASTTSTGKYFLFEHQ